MGGMATHAGGHHFGQGGGLIGTTGNGFGGILTGFGKVHRIGHILRLEEGSNFFERVGGLFSISLGGGAVSGSADGATGTGDGLHQGLKRGFILSNSQTCERRNSDEEKRYFTHA